MDFPPSSDFQASADFSFVLNHLISTALLDGRIKSGEKNLTLFTRLATLATHFTFSCPCPLPRGLEAFSVW